MKRIDDFNVFSSSSKKSLTNENSFVHELNYLDMTFTNVPPELKDIDDSRCQIEYTVSVGRDKMGINSLDIRVDSIEIEVKVDDHPREPKKFEFEIIPGTSVDEKTVFSDISDKPIPTYPTQISIDMRRSMDIREFKVIVKFGKD
jgi:hypothetical protein